MRALRLAVLFALLLPGGCRRAASVPDAGTGVFRPFTEIPLVVALPAAWSIHADAGTPGLDVRRRGDGARPFLVSPRLSLSLDVLEPSAGAEGSETAATRLDAELRGLRALEADGTIRIDKASRAQEQLAGRTAERLTVAYRVPTQGSAQAGVELTQELRVLEAVTSSGAPALVTVGVTYVAADADQVATEVETVLKTIHFAP